MKNLYHIYLYQPILLVLTFIYEKIAFHSLGFSIALLTILIRLILFPLFYKGAKHQTIIQKIQPLVKKIQRDHKDDKEEQARALMALYKEHKINPFTSLLLIFFQLPILIALYRVFLKEIGNFDNIIFLGFINLRNRSLVVAFIAAILQYYQVKLSLPKINSNDDKASQMGRAMIYIGPILTLAILSSFPSAIGIYWITSTLFSIGQQLVINKHVYGRDTKEDQKLNQSNGI